MRLINTMPEKSPELYITLGTILGAAVTKILGLVIKKNFSEAADIRKELRLEVARLMQEMKGLHIEIDHWKDKYYQLAEQNIQLKTECKQLKNEVELLRVSYSAKS